VKRNVSGSTSVQVLEKLNKRNVVLKTFGVARTEAGIRDLRERALHFIDSHTGQGLLDLTDLDDHWFDLVFNSIKDVRLLGPELVLGKLFDQIGFDRIQQDLFRHLVIARIISPGSKLKTVRYLEEHQRVSWDVQQIYRYMDKLHSSQKEVVEQISYDHTVHVLGGELSVVFYDVTTIYFEAAQGDDLRIPGFSKDGKHSDPQILLGLLVSPSGYPLAYDIFEGNTYEGHTMMQVIDGFKAKYGPEKLIVVADAGLLNRGNIEQLIKGGYRYILGAKIKGEKAAVQKEILGAKLHDGCSKVITKDDGSRLILNYSEARAINDRRNREKGLVRLERSLANGRLTKKNINNRGYNKYLSIKGELEVSIDHGKFQSDGQWDGLKGYQTNTTMKPRTLLQTYKQLWHIEKAFRISKTDLRIRPIYHRARRRIEAHICISFTAYKVYKELERQLAQKGGGITVERAIECLKTIYGVTIVQPRSGQSRTRLFTNNHDQEMLLDLFEIDAG
jgi:transposase